MFGKILYSSWFPLRLSSTHINTLTKLCDIITPSNNKVSVTFYKDTHNLHELLYHLDIIFYGHHGQIDNPKPQEKDEMSY